MVLHPFNGTWHINTIKYLLNLCFFGLIVCSTSVCEWGFVRTSFQLTAAEGQSLCMTLSLDKLRTP